MVKGNVGTGEYTYNNVLRYIGYAPIKNTNWCIGIIVPKSEVLSQLDTLKISIFIASLVIYWLD